MSSFWSTLSDHTPSLSDPDKFAEFYAAQNTENKIRALQIKDYQGRRSKREGFIRYVVVSDSHNRKNIISEIPDGDVLLHCGDFTLRSMKSEFRSFNNWIGTLPHPTKIVIAGNHDRFLEIRPLNKFISSVGASSREELLGELTNVTYIEDETVNVHGYNVYGSPWTPIHLGGFQKKRGSSINAIWEGIPESTDILLTHGPPCGVGDLTRAGYYAGCVNLLRQIQTRIKPIYHCFGHIHEGNGVYTDSQTTYINAALCDVSYRPHQPAYVFDLPIKEQSKEQPSTSNGKTSSDGDISIEEQIDTEGQISVAEQLPT